MTDKVVIDGLEFDGEGQSAWIYTKLIGWASSPPMRDESEARPNADGNFGVSRAYRGPRVLTFIGALAGETYAQAESELWDAWAAIQSDGKPFPLTVVNDNGSRTCMVSLSGVAEVDEMGDSPNVAEITAQFIAYDPVKYGPDRLFVTGLPVAGGGLEYPLHSPSGALFYGGNGVLGRVTVSNDGTAAVHPRVNVTGGLAEGFFIQRLDTGQVVRYDRVVPPGSTVDIDFRTGSVVVDGESDGSTYLTRSEFFSIAAKESFEVQFNPIGGSSGTPLMTLTSANGFW